MKKTALIILLFSIAVILLLATNLLILRAVSQKEIDDVTPRILCSELKKYNPEILWIIPNYNNTDISKNQTWCQEILELNKIIGMHGIKHTYKEFEKNISQAELESAIQIWKNCFKSAPTLFKAPQLALSKQNKKLLQENNFTIKGQTNQIIHKVYHCNDTGLLSNKIINLI